MVLAEDADGLRYMTRALGEYYQAAGLTINIIKSEYMFVKNDGMTKLQRETEATRRVDRYKYFGIISKKKETAKRDLKKTNNNKLLATEMNF